MQETMLEEVGHESGEEKNQELYPWVGACNKDQVESPCTSVLGDFYDI